MPVLLHRMGLGAYAKKSCPSPFREDKRPSWGIYQRDGRWFWKDHGNGDGGDEITLLARWKGLDAKRDFPQLIRIYADLAAIPLDGDGRRFAAPAVTRETEPLSWSTCISAIGTHEIQKLAQWRSYSLEFCAWLRAENLIGLYNGNWALPVHGEAGAVVACHYRVDRGDGERPDWFYFPKGVGTRPLIFGDPSRAANGFVFESPWDAFAVMDKLGWHKPNGIPGTAIIITRGADNGRLVAGLFKPESAVYAFKQNDETKNGKNASDRWLAAVAGQAGCCVRLVVTPTQFKDPNEWTRAGATGAVIMVAIQDARVVNSPSDLPRAAGGGENVEIVENPALGVVDAPASSTFSTLSTTKGKLETAIYPVGSWLDRYMDCARQREESADSYLLGSVLPVVSVMLARRVWLPWGDGKVFPNLFTMLAGKPGDRKSSAINMAERVARMVLDKKHFLPDAMSAEAMFDEYDQDLGGSPDKLLVADDANAFLGMLQKTNYGERVGQALLRLYDCKGLAESFRRNQKGEEGAERRYIAETSTSMVLGATFNICQFQGHEIRSGLQRRFLYYLAEGHGRFIGVPMRSDQMEFLNLCERLAKLSKLDGLDSELSPDALALWEEFQKQNRRRLAGDGFGAAHDAYLARLNGQPNHVLKIAMLFQAALWAEAETDPNGLIEAPTLQVAIDHTELCLTAAQVLDQIANRARIREDADVLLANIVQDFSHKVTQGVINLTRTELTGKYAHHSGRKGTPTPDLLYLRLIPDLIRQDKAREIRREGKPSSFAFRADEGCFNQGVVVTPGGGALGS